MAAVGGASLAACVCVVMLHAVTGLVSRDLQCAFMDQEAEPLHGPTNELRGSVRANGTVRCLPGSRCYGLWEKRPDGEVHLVKQGCWPHLGNQEQCHGDRCLVTAPPSQIQNASYRFCCCGEDLCNANFTEAPPTARTPALTDQRSLRREETALVALVTIAIAAFVIVASFLGYRVMKGKRKHTLSALDVMEANTHTTVDLEHLKLLELIGRGRYGTVFRGCLGDGCVAVKLFSSANRQNFVSERSMYGLPLLRQHQNIARFLSADERTAADGRPEFLILMEFYPHGCLSGYLSVHTVDWSTCCRMTHGVTRGLAFLHTEIYRGDQYKPAVAHRDVTSRNVLVRSDLSCVLADFGLSMRLTGSRPGDDDTMAISEVGTVRYMAPEVLGGALNLRDCESALKQVDVYALGLLYWETFRRCSHLYPGEVVPEYQLAFQAELGNHPTFEEMQILVAREKSRPRFPESWKENSLALRSLKETMEDCWDQDAEARLTAQCAEERLCDLMLMTSHTAVHNHRNLCQGRWPPQAGSTSPYIEDLQVGVVKNLQGDGHPATVVKTTSGGSEGSEKNRNAINYERQKAQARSSMSDSTQSCDLTPGSALCVPVCLQLTEEDLEATKLDPKEVDKNLRESSNENLLERSQKQFSSIEQQTQNLLHRQATGSVSVLQGDPLPKQHNLPQRPTSLHLLPKTKESGSSRLKLGKLKSNHRQVETGVAKMNTVTVATAAEPQQITTVTNNTTTRSTAGRVHSKMVAANGYSVGVATLVTNGMMGGGRTNPAGPQLEEEKMDGGPTGGGPTGGGPTGGGPAGGGPTVGGVNLLNSSPDEHEPLLSREQLPAESEPLPLPRLHQPRAGQGSNSNNNNNRTAPRSIKTPQTGPERVCGPEVSQGESIGPEPQPAGQQVCGPAAPDQDPEPRGPDTGPCVQTEPVLTPESTRNPKAHLVHSTATARVPGCRDPESSSAEAPVPGSPDPQAQDLVTSTSSSQAAVSQVVNIVPEDPALNPPDPDPEAPSMNPEVLLSANPEASALRSPASDPQVQLKDQIRTKRRERPCSLDLSSSCVSSDDVSLTESLSASGEKIKRRVKTPYTLKKWRPASWVVSTDTALDPDFMFNASSSSSSSQTQTRPGGLGIPRINQSKSSMAVFWVGGGTTETTTSEPDGMTCF